MPTFPFATEKGSLLGIAAAARRGLFATRFFIGRVFTVLAATASAAAAAKTSRLVTTPYPIPFVSANTTVSMRSSPRRGGRGC